MKKTFAAFLIVLLWQAFPVWANELKIGEKAPDFALEDSSGKIYTLDSKEFQGRVISIFYMEPCKKNWNKHVETALLKDEELDRKNNYMNIYISNLKASNMPNLIMKRVIKNKEENTDSLILLDKDYSIVKEWGLNNHSSDIVVLDKEKICRYVYKGKLPQPEVKKLISIIKEYQVK
jgi:predicted transcriptional regulator